MDITLRPALCMFRFVAVDSRSCVRPGAYETVYNSPYLKLLPPTAWVLLFSEDGGKV